MNRLCEILIVDSQADYIESFRNEMLNLSEYTIKQSDTGVEALEIINRCNPMMVIVDWELSDMSGIDMVNLFKDRAKSIDTITIMTCAKEITPEINKQSLETGCLSIIKKPIDTNSLAERIHHFLKKYDSPNSLIEEKDQEIAKKELSIIQTQSFLSGISKQLELVKQNIKPEDKAASKLIQDLLNSIDEQQKLNKRTRYDLSINNLHPNFEKNLTSHKSNLTANDIRLCSLIRLGLNSKDIATVLNVSPDSVKVARSRLRKKLGIDKEQNLVSFLATF